MTAQEALTKWDAGEIVTSIEMGGIGPSYEQAIQIAIFEFIRRGEKGLHGLGLSGGQAGAAASVAKYAIKHGWEATLALVPSDRHILVSKDWPVAPAPSPAEEPKPAPSRETRCDPATCNDGTGMVCDACAIRLADENPPPASRGDEGETRCVARTPGCPGGRTAYVDPGIAGCWTCGRPTPGAQETGE